MDDRFDKISELIDKNAPRFEASGAFSVYLEKKPALRKYFGISNRETDDPVTENTRYIASLESSFFIGLCILILSDMKKLKLSDKLSCFIPEYKHADEMTILNLFKEKSGIRDFLFGELQPKALSDPEYMGLTDEQRRKIDSELFISHHSFDEVMGIIGEKELESKPGVTEDYSESNCVFLREVIERASGTSLREFAEKHIFEKLGMEGVRFGLSGAAPVYTLFRNKTFIRLDLEGKNPNHFTVGIADLEKLMLGLFGRKLFSERTWKTATKFDKYGEGLVFSDTNGTVIVDFGVGGAGSITMYYDEGQELCYLLASNSDSKYELCEDNDVYFNREIRYGMEGLFTYPKNTRMVPFGLKNAFAAAQLKIRPDQFEFVPGAKDTIVSFAADKNKKLFVEMEGGRAVGLLLLEVNKKEDEYHICIVLIDKRYQQRGFGKVMLRFAVDYLKKAGAKKLSIGVVRFNIPAQKLYKSVGFHEDGVYEEFISMTQKLTDEQ